jgi:hypothetical protein
MARYCRHSYRSPPLGLSQRSADWTARRRRHVLPDRLRWVHPSGTTIGQLKIRSKRDIPIAPSCHSAQSEAQVKPPQHTVPARDQKESSVFLTPLFCCYALLLLRLRPSTHPKIKIGGSQKATVRAKLVTSGLRKGNAHSFSTFSCCVANIFPSGEKKARLHCKNAACCFPVSVSHSLITESPGW